MVPRLLDGADLKNVISSKLSSVSSTLTDWHFYLVCIALSVYNVMFTATLADI